MTRAENGTWKIEIGKLPSLLRRGHRGAREFPSLPRRGPRGGSELPSLLRRGPRGGSESLLVRRGLRGGSELPSLLRRGLRGGVLVLLFALTLLVVRPASAQVATGFPPFGSFSGGGTFDTVDNANLNVHFAIPIINKAGVGLPFDYGVTYDSSIWYQSGSAWLPVSNFGWGGYSQVGTGYVNYSLTQGQCVIDAHPYYYNIISNFYYYDAQNTSHSFTGLSVSNGNTTPCPSNSYPPASGSATVYDGSGWSIQVQMGSSGYLSSLTVTSRSGVAYSPPQGTGNPSSGTYTLTTPNGNVITFNAPSSYTDTLGKSVLTIQGSPSSGAVTYGWTPPNGGTGKVTFKYQQYTVQTNFGCSGVGEYGATSQYLVYEIDMPDISTYSTDKYTISYETTPSHSPHVTGRIQSITLPTGGSITYTYSGGGNGIMCSSGGTVTMTRKINDDNNNNSTWTYQLTANSPPMVQTIVTDPQNNVTDYDLHGIYQTESVVYQGSSTVLGGTTTCYNGASAPCNGTAVSLPITEVATATDLAGEYNETDAFYNAYGLPTTTDSYDFGSGSHGSLLSETMICYSTSLGYILDRPAYQMVYSQTGNSSNCTGTVGLLAKAAYGYDSHGNLQTETHTNTGGSPSSISRSFTYNSNGTLSTATDYNSSSHLTSYTYGTGSCNGAFPTAITLPITSLAYQLTWDCNGGVLLSIQDPNQATTTYKYTDPNFWRLMEVDYPDTGKTTYSYNDSPFFSVSTYSYLNSTTYHETTQVMDGLGRVINSQDNALGTSVDTTYDGLGRVASVSNAHTGTSQATDGVTYYSYDAWGRLSDEGSTHAIKYPDGSYTSVLYSSSGQCPTITDAAGRARTVCPDGLGRTLNVTEDPGSSGHFSFQTSYAYDALSDLTGVTQSSQTRTFNYDMLARLTSAYTPEVSTSPTFAECKTSYGYDANGNLTSKTAPLQNQSSSCTNTVTTTYGYDAVNRLTSKTYNDGATPTANYFYDQAPSTMPAWTGVSFANAKGRMVLTCTNTASLTCTGPSTATAYSYDTMGRPVNFWQCNPSNCGSSSITGMQYNYDLAGDVNYWYHPDGTKFTNTVNNAQQITAIGTPWTDGYHPSSLATNIGYAPWGAVNSLTNGCAGSGCTNTVETYTYNNRLQPWMIQLGTTTGGTSAEACWLYNYFSSWSGYSSCPTASSVPTSGSGNNGNVNAYYYKDNFQCFSHTATFTYDSVNRLTAASAAVANGCTNTYGQTYSYTGDGTTNGTYGNMTCATGCTTAPANMPANLTFSASSNHITSSGYSYDAVGNLLTDASNSASHTYQWDAEGRISKVDPANNPPTWTFTYNAMGDYVQFVSPSGTSEFYVDPSGNGLGAVGSYSIVYRGAGMTPLAVYNSGETWFHHINNIESRTFMTTHYGTVSQDMVFYPWGEEWLNWGGGGVEFANLNFYDTNLNVDFTEYRAMSNNMGRWHSADPLGGDLTNPQSLNRYAYVLNNPTGLIDPLGLDPGQGSDPGECSCYDPNCVNAACWSPGWPPPFWPPDGGEEPGGGGPSVDLPTGNTGGEGNDFIGLPCVQNVSDLIPLIYLGLSRPFPNAKIGPIKAVTGPGGVVGGAQVFNVPNITPTTDVPYDWPKLPGFGPGHYQVYVPVPEKPTGGQNGAGNILHVEYDVSTNAAGQVTAVTGIYTHWDIGNPVKGHGIGIPWHLLTDFGIARASSRLCGGGPVKFD